MNDDDDRIGAEDAEERIKAKIRLTILDDIGTLVRAKSTQRRFSPDADDDVLLPPDRFRGEARPGAVKIHDVSDTLVKSKFTNRDSSPGAVDDTPPTLNLNRGGRFQEVEHPGAFAVPDQDFQEYDDAFEEEVKRIDSLTTMEIFEGQLATGARNDSQNTEALVVDAVNMPEPRKKVNQLRRSILFTFLCIVISVIIGSILFALLRNDGDERLAPNPTGSPTTGEYQDEQIVSYLLESTTKEGSFEPGSTGAMASDWIVFDDPMQVKELSNVLLQRFVLAWFYFETTRGGERPWKRCNPPEDGEDDLCIKLHSEARWLSAHNECNWYGIECDETSGYVTKIHLKNNGLVGTIPSTISALRSLQHLVLFNDGFLTGTIPDSIYSNTMLTNLSLFNSKKLRGTISTKIGLLSNLKSLQLSLNDLSGTIPTEVGALTRLSRLQLAENPRLEGSIPESIYGLTRLSSLMVYNSSITGTLSTQLGHLSNLDSLLVYRTKIQGTIPTEIRGCKQLKQFQIFETRIGGEIPSEIGMLTQMESLLLGQDEANEYGHTGTIPEELYSMTNLKNFVLSYTNIEGTISSRIGQLDSLLAMYIDDNEKLGGTLPSEIGNLTGLRILQAENNSLTGSIPTEIGDLTELISIHFSSNYLDGEIPSQIGSLGNIEFLNLPYNFLRGRLPSEIGNCSKLQFMDLRLNRLHGPIPSELGSLHSMGFLVMFDNSISGTIPDELYDMKKLSILGLITTSLTGTISTLVGRLTKLESLLLQDSRLTGTVPTEIGKLSVLNELGLGDTLLRGPVSYQVCELPMLKIASADCEPEDDPPVPCYCCNICYNRENGKWYEWID